MSSSAPALEVRAEARQQQAQRLSLTPLMRQSLKVLQMPAAELEAYLLERALDNPLVDLDALDAPEDLQWDGSYAGTSAEGDPLATARAPVTFKDMLLEQLPACDLGEREEAVCRWLIECLDRRGYLPEGLGAERVEDASLRAAFQRALEVLQSLEPAGVGARTLEECLLLQLDRIRSDAECCRDDAECCREIVRGHLEDLGRNRTAAIAAALGRPRQQVEEAAEVLRRLSPIPACGYETGSDATYIRPEAVVAAAEDGTLEVRPVASWSSRIRLDDRLASRLGRESEDGRVARWLSEGQSLRSMVAERETTVVAVIRAVVSRQVEAVSEGMGALVPLTMGEIARDLGVSESTVSRAVRDKWILAPCGMVELRSFFSAVSYAPEMGGISAESARARLRELIAGEDPHRPLSDQRLADLLAQDGVSLSRRVVAKYRDAMGIPSSSVRRRS